MYDLTRYICPQLFVQFKLILKNHNRSEDMVFIFAENAQISDVFRYLDNQQIDYSWYQNQLIVDNSFKEKV